MCPSAPFVALSVKLPFVLMAVLSSTCREDIWGLCEPDEADLFARGFCQTHCRHDYMAFVLGHGRNLVM